MTHTVDRIPGDSGSKRVRALIFEAIRFVGSGLLVFPIGLAVSALCHEVLGMREEFAALIALAALIVTNFIVSRKLVFRSSGHMGRQLPRFIAVALVMRGIEYVLFLALFRYVHIPYLVAMVATLVTSSAFKFVLYRTLVFKHKNVMVSGE